MYLRENDYDNIEDHVATVLFIMNKYYVEKGYLINVYIGDENRTYEFTNEEIFYLYDPPEREGFIEFMNAHMK